jgi:hypothetical protein
MSAIDIQLLLEAVNGSGWAEFLGKITAMLRAVDELARHDKRWLPIAAEIADLWCALMTKDAMKVRKHACKVLDQIDCLAGGTP